MAEKDAKVLATEKQQWRKRALQDWSAMSIEPSAAANAGQSKARPRAKALEWLFASDHQLFVSTGHRWEHFALPHPPFKCPPPEQWPVATVSVDQGSDGWSACWFLMNRLGVSLMLLKDPSHRCWNDVWLSLEHAGLKSVFTLLICIINADGGPWGEDRWIHTGREAVCAYMAVSDHTDPLFQEHAAAIVREMGLAHRLDEGDALLQEVHASLPECVRKKTDKVATSRWFGVFNSLDGYLEIWTRRRLLLQWMGVGLGLFSCAASGVMAKLRTCVEAQAGADVPKAPTSKEGAGVASIRQSCKNTLQLCYLALADTEFRTLVEGIHKLVGGVRGEFRLQHLAVRSGPEARAMYTSWAMGAGREALKTTVATLYSQTFLEELDLHRPGYMPIIFESGGADATHPTAVLESLVMEKFADFTLQLLKNRLRSLAWSERGYPGRFAALLHSPLAADTLLAQMRLDWDLWHHIGSFKTAFWDRLRERSPFAQVAVQKVFLMAAQSGWVMTDALAAAVSDMFTCVGQTNTDENGFKIQRVQESSSCQRGLSGRRKWFSLIRSNLASTVFRYSELPGYTSMPIPPTFHWRDMQSLYEAKVSDSWKRLKLILSSGKRTPDWYSPSARNEVAGDVDLDSWRMLNSKLLGPGRQTISWMLAVLQEDGGAEPELLR